MEISEEQFRKVFPSYPHLEHPSAGNGYGWCGNGFGWQLEPFPDPPERTEPQEAVNVPIPEILTYDEPVVIDLDDVAYKFEESTLLFKSEEQNFHKLRDDNLRNGTLFEDPNFPADISSLRFNSRRTEFDDVIWLRPKEISRDAKMFVGGSSRFDAKQGEFGNCWFLAAIANLAMHPHLLVQVVPEDQNFEEKYAGIFHFRFWQFGTWVDVVIDDYLPMRNKELISVKSSAGNEFWSALLEKAYAKLHGSYEALESGNPMEAMQDLTGGVVENFNMNGNLPNLFNILVKAVQRCSLIFGLSAIPPNVTDQKTPNGLVVSHIYAITNAKYVLTSDDSAETGILRLRNPWGKTEWKGSWNDNAPHWHTLSEEVKKEIGFTPNNEDGEFWMSYENFTSNFDSVEICHLTRDSLSQQDIADITKKKWEVTEFENSWVCGLTAGGYAGDLEYFVRNPQYRIALTEPDEGDKYSKCTLIISLLRKHRRVMHFRGAKILYIGFYIFSLTGSDGLPKPLTLQFFKDNRPVARVPSHINLCDVTCRFRLPRGNYCIIPSTYTIGKEGSFMLRVFTEKESNVEEYDNKVEFIELDDLVSNRISTTEEQEIDERVHELFLKLAGDNLEISLAQLKEILDIAMKEGTKSNKIFTEEVCRSLVALSDVDHSGKLDYDEFKKLWKDINIWKAAFEMHDETKTGTLTGHELIKAFISAGYSVNLHILIDLMHRYSNKECQLNFADYILCILKVKTMIELFNSKKISDGESEIAFGMEEWLQVILYC